MTINQSDRVVIYFTNWVRGDWPNLDEKKTL